VLANAVFGQSQGRSASVQSSLRVPGAGHGFGFNPNGQSVLPAILGFLDRSLASANTG
jgi:hypothetical protein